MAQLNNTETIIIVMLPNGGKHQSILCWTQL